MKTEPFSIVVLAGGQSSRMGRDKATLAWEDNDILGSLLTRLLPLSEDVLVVSNTIRIVPTTVRQVTDLIPGKGPLSGIHAGLTYARYELVFVTACDVPFLRPDIIPLIAGAVGQNDAGVTVYKGQMEPLCACYRKRCADIAKQALAEEKYRVKEFLAQIQWVPIQQFDEVGDDCFMNVNTYHDYEKARAILAKGR